MRPRLASTSRVAAAKPRVIPPSRSLLYPPQSIRTNPLAATGLSIAASPPRPTFPSPLSRRRLVWRWPFHFERDKPLPPPQPDPVYDSENPPPCPARGSHVTFEDLQDAELADPGSEIVKPLPVCPICKRKRSGRGYEVRQVIGKGEFGLVLLVDELCQNNRRRSGRQWALKWLALGTQEMALKALSREALALQTLQHPNIVGFRDAFVALDKPELEPDDNSLPPCPDPEEDTSQRLFRVGLVMENCHRGDLRNLLPELADQQLPEGLLCAIIYQVASALASIHAKGFVHRDIKPHNLLIGANGHVKVGDLGVAKHLDDDVTGTFAGTPAYLAPEVHQYKPYGSKADCWSLGSTLLELATGVPVLERYKQDHSRPMCVAKRRQRNQWRYEIAARGYSPAVCDVIMDLLAKNEKDRPTMDEVLTRPVVCEGPMYYTELSRRLLAVHDQKKRDGTFSTDGDSKKLSSQDQADLATNLAIQEAIDMARFG